MKTKLSLSLSVALLVFAATPIMAAAADQEGVAVAIVFDTSGSMRDTVKDSAGGNSPKYRIANRALEAVANQLEAASTGSAGTGRKIYAGLITFAVDGAQTAVPFGPLNAASLRNWAKGFKSPSGGTPLGIAMETAQGALLKSGTPRKHVLVITDGINTVGPDPAQVLPRLIQQNQQAQTSVSYHFIAFDVDSKLFAPLKKLGATVVGAADEKQLNVQLDFILQRKILLEDEEPPRKQ